MTTYQELIELGLASEVTDETLCFCPRGKVYRLTVEVHRSLLLGHDLPSEYVGFLFPFRDFRNSKDLWIVWHFTDLEDLFLASSL